MDLLTALFTDGRDHPEALRIDDRALSRAALVSAADALAARIAGAPAVAVQATPSVETVIAVVAGLLAGVPVVPVPPDSGPAERGHILRDSAAAILLARDPETWPDTGVETMPIDPSARPAAASYPSAEGRGGAMASAPATEAAPGGAGWAGECRPGGGRALGKSIADDTPAMILYTSGTTGPPKGALLSRAAIAADLDALASAWEWTAQDTLVHGLPLFHVHGLVLGVLGALRTGSRLVHTGRPKPERYARAGGSLYFGVPTVWSRIAADPAAARALRSARLLVSGSAALPAPVFRDLEKLTGHRPVERYGMTETLITVSARADGPRNPGAVGVPLPGVRTRLAVDGTGSEIGELQVAGPTLFNGYVNRPEATARCFTEDGWFRTGDMAVIEPDGTHRIVGRASTDLIKSGGYRIGAGEVENALLDHPAVTEAAVVGAPHADLGQEIVAYVVADGVTERDLVDFVAQQLSAHKRPRKVRFLKALPRNAMGKPQKQLLPPP